MGERVIPIYLLLKNQSPLSRSPRRLLPSRSKMTGFPARSIGPIAGCRGRGRGGGLLPATRGSSSRAGRGKWGMQLGPLYLFCCFVASGAPRARAAAFGPGRAFSGPRSLRSGAGASAERLRSGWTSPGRGRGARRGPGVAEGQGGARALASPSGFDSSALPCAAPRALQ